MNGDARSWNVCFEGRKKKVVIESLGEIGLKL
jgi:hypothetical protein